MLSSRLQLLIKWVWLCVSGLVSSSVLRTSRKLKATLRRVLHQISVFHRPAILREKNLYSSNATQRANTTEPQASMTPGKTPKPGSEKPHPPRRPLTHPKGEGGGDTGSSADRPPPDTTQTRRAPLTFDPDFLTIGFFYTLTCPI